MSYQTLMVHLQLGHANAQVEQSNAAVIHAAKQIAKRCNAAVIGIVVGQQTQMIYGKGYALIDFFDREQDFLEERIAVEEALFRTAFKGHDKAVEWCSIITMEPVVDFIVAQACRADLIITGVTASDFYEGPSSAHAGEIVMQSGRPVLAVPVTSNQFNLENMLIGWKDTREARRAIADALPLLKLATKVTVFEIVPIDEKKDSVKRLNEVVNWLKSHEIEAEALATVSNDTDASQFITLAKKHQANMVVTGAYGHSRLREWVLGGVTDELLRGAHFCTFLSH